MREYDFKVKGNIMATIMVEAESEEEAKRIAEDMFHYPKTAVVDSIEVHRD